MAVKAISAARASRRKTYKHGENEYRCDHQRLSEIPQGTLDEIRRTMQGGIHRNALRLQGRSQARERLFDGPGNRQRVRAILAGQRQQDARLAHHQGIA
jgi:hypothetical protein